MEKFKPIGYKYIENYLKENNINVLPYYRESYIKESGIHIVTQKNEIKIHYYPKKYEVNEDIFSNLEFSLKHEGLNLLLIKELFKIVSEKEVESYLK